MYRRILIVVAPAPTTRAAVIEGVALAKSQTAEVFFFSVLPRYVVPVADMPLLGMPSPADFQREATGIAGRHLAAASVVADKAGVRHRHAVGAGADDAECIVDAALKHHCDLIVIASAGRNAVMRLISGSAIPGLITQSPIPILVVRQPTAAVRKKRVAAVPPKPRPVRRKAEAVTRVRRRVAT